MRSIPIFCLALGVAAGAAQAQGRGPRPLPDHWMTIDSIAQAVGLTDAQRPEFVKHYDALNAAMKKVADERRAWVESLGGERPTPEQMQAQRAKSEFAQTEIDNHYNELRKLLAEDQHARFDALAKPTVMMQRRPPGGGD